MVFLRQAIFEIMSNEFNFAPFIGWVALLMLEDFELEPLRLSGPVFDLFREVRSSALRVCGVDEVLDAALGIGTVAGAH